MQEKHEKKEEPKVGQDIGKTGGQPGSTPDWEKKEKKEGSVPGGGSKPR